MAAPVAPVATLPTPLPDLPPPSGGRRIHAAASAWRPKWSTPAAWRAIRATLIMPGLFAFTGQVLKVPQMATFAAFGSFATLVLAGFGGSRRDKLVAHATLAVAGSVLLVIGTIVSSSTPLAAGVTLVVAFCVLFTGIAGPNAATGATATLLAYVLPAASPGTLSMAPDRLAGWWLASAIGTVAVLTLAPRPAANRLRATAARSANVLAEQLEAALAGGCSKEHAEASIAVKHELEAVFGAAPYRPTGLAVADQALASLVEALEWSTTVVSEAVREGTDLTTVAETDRRLFGEAVVVLRDTARLLEGADIVPPLGNLEQLRAASAARTAAVGDARTAAVVIGTRQVPPDAALPALRANLRLDDAVRALTAEQGTKRVPKEQVWRLVGGAMRLRLTAQSLTGQPRPPVPGGPTHRALVEEAVAVAGMCDDLASRLGRVPPTVARELAALVASDPQPLPAERGYSLWVRQHLDHVKRDLASLVAPTEAVAAARALPWWR